MATPLSGSTSAKQPGGSCAGRPWGAHACSAQRVASAGPGLRGNPGRAGGEEGRGGGPAQASRAGREGGAPGASGVPCAEGRGGWGAGACFRFHSTPATEAAGPDAASPQTLDGTEGRARSRPTSQQHETEPGPSLGVREVGAGVALPLGQRRQLYWRTHICTRVLQNTTQPRGRADAHDPRVKKKHRERPPRAWRGRRRHQGRRPFSGRGRSRSAR